MVEVRETDVFSRWFKSLRDVKAQARIQTRINRLTIGLLGDVKFFGGIGELRIDYGPGYRIYFVQHTVSGSWRATNPHSFFSMMDEARARAALASAISAAG